MSTTYLWSRLDKGWANSAVSKMPTKSAGASVAQREKIAARSSGLTGIHRPPVHSRDDRVCASAPAAQPAPRAIYHAARRTGRAIVKPHPVHPVQGTWVGSHHGYVLVQFSTRV